MDRLARAVRCTERYWPAIIAVRTLLFGTVVGWSRLVSQIREPGFVQIYLLQALLDIALITSPHLSSYRRLTPNRKWVLTGPLVAMSGALFTLSVSVAGADHISAAVTLLTPALLMMIMTRSFLLLGIAYGVGSILTLAGQSTFAAQIAAFLCLASMILLNSLLGEPPSNATDDTGLSGEQARAFLIDFEQAKRGWFWQTDRAGKLTYISETLAAQLDHSAHDLIGQPLTALIASTDCDVQSDGGRTLSFHLSARTAFADIAVRAAGAQAERWWAICGQPVTTPYGQFIGFRGSGSDLTEMRRSQAEIARLAQFDSLTGLANRMQMLTTLEQALAHHHGAPGACALLMLDLDRFKEVNDTMGHPAGDSLLRQVAQRLLRLAGTSGKVGRLGGDEFQIVLPGMSERSELTRLGTAIIHNLSQPYVVDGSQVVIGVSIGIAVAPANGTSAETLIRNADLALYAAKAEGRGLFRYYAPAMHADADDRRQIEQDLRQAIVTGGLHLAYQPIVCASTERIAGFEALIRWHHPTRGPISPATFIPVAENAGLIGAIGEWVLRTACHDAAQWPEGTRVAVNVSPLQFINPSLPAQVMSALANAGLSASRLELEITEGVFLSGGAGTDRMFRTLKKIGVRLALDDFGTGYSALGYLKTAPFDKIKIDQSFVRGAAVNGSRNAAIVKSIVNLAEALGMETTAEGAETLDELELIRSLGCSHVQGYVYGRPINTAATVALLADNNGHARASGHKASRERRMTLLRSVTLHVGDRDHPARIRNVSAHGAMIEGITGVSAGTRVRVELAAGYTVTGSCRWCLGDRIGVEFEQAIDSDRLRSSSTETARFRERQQTAADTLAFYRNRWREVG
ncbi:MAG TPA: EAL domain-containing protein [Sphingobium sp.]|nr:EAL domain-containing protein [Sphingobium sp.]